MLPQQMTFLATTLLFGSNLRFSHGLAIPPPRRPTGGDGAAVTCIKNVPPINDVVPVAIGKALIDYSAAAEYVNAHYGIPSYFGGDEESRREEWIFDARKGIPLFGNNDNDDDDDNDNDNDNEKSNNNLQQQQQTARLDEIGFELFPSATKVTDFSDMQQISSQYLPELRELIPKALLGVDNDDEADDNVDGDGDSDKKNNMIDTIVFWHPMLRGEGDEIQPRSESRPSTAGVAAMVHMDTDVGAYGLDGILNLVRKNRIIEQQGMDEDDADWTNLADRIRQEGKRLILLNIWRPLRPVTSAPLGLWAVRYTKQDDDDDESFPFFPTATPCLKTSRWYVFSHMKPDECLIFKQFDRDQQKISDIWHCAIPLQQQQQQ